MDPDLHRRCQNHSLGSLGERGGGRRSAPSRCRRQYQPFVVASRATSGVPSYTGEMAAVGHIETPPSEKDRKVSAEAVPLETHLIGHGNRNLTQLSLWLSWACIDCATWHGYDEIHSMDSREWGKCIVKRQERKKRGQCHLLLIMERALSQGDVDCKWLRCARPERTGRREKLVVRTGCS